MIFATVGTQLPFDRMVEALDRLASKMTEQVVIQTGPTSLRLEHATGYEALDPTRYDEIVQSARVLISHAGIGSVLTASSYGKALIIMPRRRALGEHRNDHQLATARRLEHRQGIYVAWQTSDLQTMLEAPELLPLEPSNAEQIEPLIERIRTFIG